MSELVKSVPVADDLIETEVQNAGKKPRTRKVLELVAMRGKEVVGVRHLLEGGTAWVGNANDAIARLSMKEFGGHPLIVGEVTSKEFAIYVPPRARARLHGDDGVPRILVGPDKITLKEGERAVLVLGPIQIRAQIVSVDMFSNALPMPAGAAGWIAFVAAVYIAALAICAALTPPTSNQVDGAGMERAHEAVIDKARGL